MKSKNFNTFLTCIMSLSQWHVIYHILQLSPLSMSNPDHVPPVGVNTVITIFKSFLEINSTIFRIHHLSWEQKDAAQEKS